MYTPHRDRSALDSLSVLQEYVVDRRMANFHPAAPPLRPISTYIHLISHMAISGIRAPTNLLAKSVPKSGHFLCSSSYFISMGPGDLSLFLRKWDTFCVIFLYVWKIEELSFQMIPKNYSKCVPFPQKKR